MSIISAHSEIIIQNNHQYVFNFLANLENDPQWRKEINSSKMNSEPQIGALVIEDSCLSKKVPNHILNLQCLEYIKDHKVIYQTVQESKFYLKSTRMVEEISSNQCKVFYKIDFDKNIVKHGTGINLPDFIVNWVVNHDMKKYLNKLKMVLEK